MAITLRARSRAMISSGLPRLTGPVTSSGTSISRTKPSTMLSFAPVK